MSCDAHERFIEYIEEQFYEEHKRYPNEEELEELCESLYD